MQMTSPRDHETFDDVSTPVVNVAPAQKSLRGHSGLRYFTGWSATHTACETSRVITIQVMGAMDPRIGGVSSIPSTSTRRLFRPHLFRDACRGKEAHRLGRGAAPSHESGSSPRACKYTSDRAACSH